MYEHVKRVNLDNGIVILEAFRRNCRLHRDPKDGPALIQHDPATGILLRCEYRWEGRLHRKDGPALVQNNPATGALMRQEFRWFGHLHREDGPAREIYDDPKTGIGRSHEYFKEGMRHREDGPALEVHDDPKNDILLMREWYRHGKLDREDGPAFEKFYKSNPGWVKSYYRLDREYREGGPTSIYRMCEDEPPFYAEAYFDTWGLRHRDPKDGPAFVAKDLETGVIVSEMYLVEDAPTRDPDDGPADIEREAESGNVWAARHHLDGELHRDPAEGAAWYTWDTASGEIYNRGYFIHGKEVSGPRRPDIEAKDARRLYQALSTPIHRPK